MMISDSPIKNVLVWTWWSLRVYTLLCGVLAARMAGTTALTIWRRWDVEYYARIASAGYSAGDGTTNFHPLFPWLAKPLALISGSPVIGLLLVSSVATLAVYLAFERLALIDQDPARAWTSTLMFICWPVSYVLYLPYTESLWLLCAVLCFSFARRGRWWLAGISGALATLTRQQGLFLVVPLACELCELSGYDLRVAMRAWRQWLALSLVPAAYVFWIVYRTVTLREGRADFSSLHSFVYSTLLSPASHLVVKDYGFTWPWKAPYLAIQRALSLSYLNPWIDLIFGALFLILIILAWPRMRTSYRLYVALIALVSFSFQTGMTSTAGAYVSLPRHLLLAFPVFIGLGARYRRLPIWIVIPGMAIATFFLFGFFWTRLVP